MTKLIKRQIERILDESAAQNVDVIVQTAVADVRIQEVLRASAAAIESRRSLITARDLVPPSRSELRTNRRRVAGHAKVSERTEASTASFGGPRHARSVVEAHRRGRMALRPLLEWHRSESNRTDLDRAARDGERRPQATPFSISGSAALSLHRDSLYRLPERVASACSVYRNQRVGVPPAAQARTEPIAVRDNRGHTWGVARTGALACWGAYGARGADVKIAVLDTGIDPDHPDLKGKISDFAEFDASGAITKSGLRHARDSGHHGTHVAGTIVGSNCGGRWIGMAPEAKILSALVLPQGGGTEAQILGGMQWALDNGADVISMSLGGVRMSADVLDTYTLMIVTAMLAGVPVVTAVGNEGSQTSGAPGNDFYAFTVGATDVSDLAAGFSGGRTQVVHESRYIDPKDLPLVYSKPDITAPGVDVLSSLPSGKYGTLSGTSMATPHVSGAIAILLSALPHLRSESGADRVNLIQQLLTSSVKELGEAGQNHRYGFGRMDVLRAVGFGRELGY